MAAAELTIVVAGRADDRGGFTVAAPSPGGYLLIVGAPSFRDSVQFFSRPPAIRSLVTRETPDRRIRVLPRIFSSHIHLPRASGSRFAAGPPLNCMVVACAAVDRCQLSREDRQSSRLGARPSPCVAVVGAASRRVWVTKVCAPADCCAFEFGTFHSFGPRRWTACCTSSVYSTGHSWLDRAARQRRIVLRFRGYRGRPSRHRGCFESTYNGASGLHQGTGTSPRCGARHRG